MKNLDVIDFPNGFSVRTVDDTPEELAYLLKYDGWTMKLAEQAHRAFRPEDFDDLTALDADEE